MAPASSFPVRMTLKEVLCFLHVVLCCVVDKFLIASGTISFSSFCQLGHQLTDAAPVPLGSNNT